MSLLRRRAPQVLACLFCGSSIIHLARPQVFESLIPSFLPDPKGVIYVSGIAELICAVGLLRRTRWAKYASAALLVGIFPGNVQMTVDAVKEANGHFTAYEFLTIVRLPLQVVLIWAALQSKPKEKTRRVAKEVSVV